MSLVPWDRGCEGIIKLSPLKEPVCKESFYGCKGITPQFSLLGKIRSLEGLLGRSGGCEVTMAKVTQPHQKHWPLPSVAAEGGSFGMHPGT